MKIKQTYDLQYFDSSTCSAPSWSVKQLTDVNRCRLTLRNTIRLHYRFLNVSSRRPSVPEPRCTSSALLSLPWSCERFESFRTSGEPDRCSLQYSSASFLWAPVWQRIQTDSETRPFKAIHKHLQIFAVKLRIKAELNFCWLFTGVSLIKPTLVNVMYLFCRTASSGISIQVSTVSSQDSCNITASIRPVFTVLRTSALVFSATVRPIRSTSECRREESSPGGEEGEKWWDRRHSKISV